MPVEALVDGCPLYDLEPAEPEGWIYGNRATLAAGASAEDDAAGAARRPQHRLQALGLRAVRLGGRLAHGAPARVGRRRGAAAARGRQRDRGLDRRQRPPGRLRPLRGHDRGGARVRPEPRLRRRRAARPDQLPQLRQPREAGHRLAARPRGQRPRRGLRRRSASRSSAATSPSTTRGRKARSTRPRWSAWSASCPTRPRSPAAPSPPRATRSRLLGPFAPTLAGSELAKQRGELDDGPAAARHRRGRRRLRDRSATRSAPAGSPPPTTSATAASPAPWPSRAIGGGLGCRVDLQPLRDRGCSPEEALFGEGSGGFLVSGERAALEALGAIHARRGRRHARSRSPPATAASPSASATAESAWRSLPARAEAVA